MWLVSDVYLGSSLLLCSYLSSGRESRTVSRGVYTLSLCPFYRVYVFGFDLFPTDFLFSSSKSELRRSFWNGCTIENLTGDFLLTLKWFPWTLLPFTLIVFRPNPYQWAILLLFSVVTLLNKPLLTLPELLSYSSGLKYIVLPSDSLLPMFRHSRCRTTKPL